MPSPTSRVPLGGEDPGELRPFALTHSRALGERVRTHAIVGLCVATVIVVGSLVARFVVGIGGLDVGALVVLGLVIAAYDSLVLLLSRGLGSPEASVASQRLLLRTMYGTTVLDYLALTAAIWLVGGTRSPFLPFFLLHVILTCLLLSRRAALVFHWLAYGLLALLVVGEWSGLIPPPHLPAGAVAGTGPLDGRYAATVLVVYGVLFALTAYLLLGFSRRLRDDERRIRNTNAELSRLSAMRRDFLRIALHNLQSPVGVVTMHLNNLKAGLGGDLTEQQANWVQRSLDRLRGVKGFMHDLQMLATLDSGRVEARSDDVNVPYMLSDLVAEHQDLARMRGQTLTLEVPPRLPTVRGVELLLREAVANYVTNAVKYTPEGGHVVVRALHVPPFVRIEVQDDGVGIPPADQERLFGEFVRIQGAGGRKDGRPEGTGLGLSIVRRVAEVHGGHASVESAPGEGSRFRLDLPASEDPPA